MQELWRPYENRHVELLGKGHLHTRKRERLLTKLRGYCVTHPDLAYCGFSGLRNACSSLRRCRYRMRTDDPL